MNLNNKINTLKENLRQIRTAIIGRGGEISETAGYRDVADAVFNIPADNAITTVTSEEISLGCQIPSNVTGCAYLAEFGGMTYKCRNIIDPVAMLAASKQTTLDGDTFTTNFSTAALFVNIKKTVRFPAGTYTVSVISEQAMDYALYAYGVSDLTAIKVVKYHGTSYKGVDTITVDEEFALCLGGYTNKGEFTFKMQVERGETATEYEPYYEGLRNTKPTEIVSKGVNLYSGSEEFVLDGTQQNITIPIVGAEEITTFSFTRDGTRVNSSSLFQLVYEDGTVFGLAPGVSSSVETIKYTAKSKVTAIKLVNWCGFTGRVYDIQLENGSAATKYKPYVGTLATYPIPEEIQALLNDGISIEHYDKVDLVNNKYLDVIDTLVLNGSETWRYNFGDGRTSEFFFIYYGASGVYADDAITCSHYDSVKFSAYDNQVGIKCNHLTNGNFIIAIRPRSDMTGYTREQWKAELSENPITVKIARQVPVETDLPVKMKPLIKVESGGTIEIKSDNGYAVPSKIICQTFTQ